MSGNWEWSGARWWKFDFHTHTPASDDYGKGPDQERLKQITPKEWLLNYMRAEIDCLAVTDHNTGGWIDKLKSAYKEMEKKRPEGFRQISIFPGVEISAHGGIHILGIFPVEKSGAEIDSVVDRCGYRCTKGQSDGVADETPTEVFEEIDKSGGIAIPAHVDNDNGLFKEYQGKTLEKELESGHVMAMEMVNPEYKKPQLYNDKKLSWTEVLGTDQHHPDGNADQRFPGSHFTWVKMSMPSLEGLKLALLDGRSSVKRSDQYHGDPNRYSHNVIEEITVEKAQFMGREKPFSVKFNPWLTAVIGGRGTGKSTLLEFLRLALRRENDLPDGLKDDFQKYYRLYRKGEEDGLIKEETRITVLYRKDNSRFRIQWDDNEQVVPIEEEIPGNEWRPAEDNISDIIRDFFPNQEEIPEYEWQPAEGDIIQRFPARIFSQKQIFELAKDPLALLRIVDEAPGVDYHAWEGRFKEEVSRYLSLGAKRREIEAGLADEARLNGELADVKRRLAIFESAGHAEVLKKYRQRRNQERAVETWEESWSKMEERLRSLAEEILPAKLDSESFNLDDPADRELLGLSRDAFSSIENVRKKLIECAKSIQDIRENWGVQRLLSNWQLEFNRADKAYRDLNERLSAEKAGDPAIYGELVQRRQTLEQTLKDMQGRRQSLEVIDKQAQDSLKRMSDIRKELTEKRRIFLSQVLADNPYIKIEVLPYGAKEIVEKEFRQLIQKESRFEKDIGNPLKPEKGGLLVDIYREPIDIGILEQRLQELKSKIRSMAKGGYRTGDLADEKFASHLKKLPPETLDRLDIWFPEDSLSVRYSPSADGKKLQSIEKGSPGQRTAALLAFFLSYGEEPIILDQPEDDLDNRLIYDLIVMQLREIKLSRQVIVVTHNANIVVNGDAELVYAFASRGGETRIDSNGSLQEKEVREKICEIMEGGREAFRERYRRIDPEGHHV